MTQQHTTLARLRFGTRDWRHSDWRDAYYPEDLPDDWRLGYYANELGAVLLDPPAWQGEADLADWSLDVHDDFRFYLMLDAAADPAAQCDRAAALEGRLGGLLWPAQAAPAGTFGIIADGLPDGVRAWGDATGIRLAVLEPAGLDLRARRALLERLAPRLAADGDVAIILDGRGVLPAEVRELQIVAELLGVA